MPFTQAEEVNFCYQFKGFLFFLNHKGVLDLVGLFVSVETDHTGFVLYSFNL